MDMITRVGSVPRCQNNVEVRESDQVVARVLSISMV